MKKFFLFISLIAFSHLISGNTPLEDFLENELKYSLNDIKVTIHNGKTKDPSEAGFEARIYYINTTKGEPLCILKKLPYDKDNRSGEKEKLCIEKISTFNIDFLDPLRVYAFKVYETENSSFSYLGMSKAEGVSLSSLIQKVGNTPRYKISRIHAMNELKNAVARIAIVFKQLHEKAPGKHLAEEYKTRNHHIIDTFLSRYSKYKNMVPKKEFASHLEKLETSFNEKQKKIGIIHGDSHPGNIYYNPQTEKVTLLDLGDMYDSIAIPGEGGPLIEDYLRVLFYMQLMSMKNHLTKKEIRELEPLFDSLYFNEGDAFDKTHILYIRQLLIMQIINTFMDENSKKASHPVFKFKKFFIVNALIKHLKNDYNLSISI